MIKKLAAIVLAAAMVIGCCACSKETAKVEPVTEVAVETVATTVPVKVGLVCLHDETSSYDLNFLESMKAACEETGVELVIKTNIPESIECYEAIADLADRGCNLIFADSFGHDSFALDAAKAFPNVEICHATGVLAHTANVPNYHNAFAHIEQGRYLAGVAAGMKMNELGIKECGYVAAFPYAEVHSGMNSYYLGVKSVCPDAVMRTSYTNSWYSITDEQEMALKFIADGAGLISGHADSPGMGQACSMKETPFVGYNMPFDTICPDQYIISSKIDWTPYFRYIIDCVQNGKTIDTDWCGDLTTGSVKMTELCEKNAAPGTKEKLEEVKQGLIDGTIKVFDVDTFTVNGEKLTSHMIDGAETVVNGEFKEGITQSAPVCDFVVDGIIVE